MWSGREYMEAKVAKLRHEGLARPKKSALFAHMVFFVNGHTQPGRDELRVLVEEHSGEWVHTDGPRVTHTICTQLSASKFAQLRPTDHALRPEWVVDSIRQGRLQPTARYDIRHRPQAAGAPPPPPPPDRNDAAEEDGDEASDDAVDEAVLRSMNCHDGAAFIRSYFQHSRLHHLSQWRADFKAAMMEELRGVRVRPTGGQPDRCVMRVDMDCYFASVAMRDNPSLRGLPVAVSHSATGKGEISSCSYEARARGIKANMFVSAALERCPELRVVPYDFPAYEQTSRALFGALREFTDTIEVGSCDEAWLDVTECVRLERVERDADEEPAVAADGDSWTARVQSLAQRIRNRVVQLTGCPCSIGASYNMMLASVALQSAKPDGLFVLCPRSAWQHMAALPVGQIPEVGWVKERQLRELGIVDCGQLRERTVEWAKELFGPKTGPRLLQYARGECDREVQVASNRQTFSLQVNSGIRFHAVSDAQNFVVELTRELLARMKGRRARKIVLSVKKKKPGWTEPSKYLGHGRAFNKTRSHRWPVAPLEDATVTRKALELFAEHGFHDCITDLVGVGVALSDFEDTHHLAKAQNQQPQQQQQQQQQQSAWDDEFAPSQQTLSQLTAKLVAAPPEPGAAKPRVKYQRLHMDDIAPDVLDELPRSLREELLADLAPKRQASGRAVFSKPSAVKRKQPDADEAVWAELPEAERLHVQRFGVQPASPPPRPPPRPQQVRLAKRAHIAAPAEPRRQAYVRVSLEDVDPDFLAALPEEDRLFQLRELEEATRLIAAPARVAEADPVDHSAALPAPAPSPFLFAPIVRYCRQRADIVAALRSVEFPTDPDECDGLASILCELLWQYVRQCLELEHNMEDARLLLRDVRAHCEAHPHPLWACIFNDVLCSANELLLALQQSHFPFDLIG